MAADFEKLYKQDSVDKQLKIEFDGGTITNTELHSHEFELNESLCSESVLRFGCCEASSIKFRISNVFTPLKNKWLAVSETLAGNTAEPFIFGRYKVDSDVPTADKRFRDVTAYDVMYDILIADVSEWYNEVLPDLSSELTMKQFRDSFFTYLGVEQQQVSLPNDSMTVQKTVDPSKISGQKVITAICELNGCFGHIGRDEKFQYIFLQEMREGLYPRNDLYPRDDLYPADPANAELISNSHYITASYEDFTTARIDKLQIRQEEDDIGCIVGTGSNCYVVQDNFLVYGKSAAELQVIAENLYAVISKVWYRPAHVIARGNPCLEVGTGIRLRTRYEIIYTYILERNLKGIQSLRDTYDAAGKQFYTENFNTVNDSIVQLRGKTNRLLRNVEETNSRITDVQAGLQSEIRQTAESITSTVSAATSKYDTTKDGTTYNISLYGYSAPANSVYPPHTYNEQYYLNNSNGYVYQSDGVNWRKVAELTLITEELNTKIEETARGIDINIKDNYLSKTEAGNTYETQTGASDKLNSAKGYADNAAGEVRTDLTNTIELTAQGLAASITAETTRASGAETTLSNTINATAEGLSTEVTRATTAEGAAAMVSRINQTAEQISIDADKLNLSSNGWNILSNGSFQLGGVGNNAALSYSVGDDYVTLRNDLSLKLHGIPLGGVRYFFTPLGGNYKYDVSNDALESLSIGSHTPSFGGTPDTSVAPPWKLNVTQYPYYTIVSGFFIISSNFSANYLFNYMLPPVLYTNKLIPGTNYYAGNQDIIFELLKYNTSTGQYSVAGTAHLSNPSPQTIDGVRRIRYSPANITTDRTLSSGTYRFSLVYDSAPIPFDDLLEAGDIYS